MKTFALSAFVLAYAAAFSQASVYIEWTNPPSSGYQIQHFFWEPMTFAYDFTVGATDILVTSIAIWDHESDGLAHSYDVVIWDSFGMVAASATIPEGTTAGLNGEYRYSHLTESVLLTAGNTYIIGAWYPDNQDAVFSWSSWNSTGNSDFAAIGANSGDIPSSALTFPDGQLDQSGPYFGPAFHYQVVPEPGTFALFILGAAVAAVFKCKRGSNKTNAAYRR